MSKPVISILLLSSLLSACSEPQVSVEIPFTATLDSIPIGCGENDNGLAMTDLRFFISAVELVHVDGRARRVNLTTDGYWQSEDVALIDLEDAGGQCINGTGDTNGMLRGKVAAGEYRGLRFVLGVPFAHNHSDPLSAPPPLDDSAMHWHWRSGYKFLRAGVATPDDGFWIHLGSSACKGTVQNITGCDAPNRVLVDLPEFVPGQHRVAFDFAELLAGVDLDDKHLSDCSSGPAEMSCREPFAALGLDLDDGQRQSTQRVFRSRER